ncbi:MAG: apolipoprotein N-acyltransferase [Candidatus Zixiibacteriota bacterium]
MKFRMPSLFSKDPEARSRRIELVFWGLIMALAYFPLGTGWLAWFAMARPLILVGPLGPRAAFTSGYLFSLVFNGVALYWIGYVTPPGYLAAIAILSLYPAVIFALFSTIYRRHSQLAFLVFPMLWVGLEHFRGLSEFSFPWTDLSYSQAYYLYFIQLASLTGAAGVSFVVALCNSFVALATRPGLLGEHRMTYFALAGIVIGANFGYGWVAVPALSSPPEIRLGLLQGNFPVETKWSPENRDYVFDVYDSLAGRAASHGSRLVVWPETAAPTYMLHDSLYVRENTKRARAAGTPNLIGTLHIDNSSPRRRVYNAAVQLEADGSMSEPYLKRRLVPFAEQVPYQEKLPFLKRDFLEKYLTFIKTYDVQWWSDFYPGDTTVLLEFDDIKYVPFICFEVAYPEYVRNSLRQGAEFILTITNDTWFKNSPGPYQHERIAIMRAVENRAWLARSANSGFTFFADTYGRKQERMEWYTRGYIVGELNRHYHPSTFYRRGPILSRYCFIFTSLTMVFFLGMAAGMRLGYWREPSAHPGV